jgi:hypothetical protein
LDVVEIIVSKVVEVLGFHKSIIGRRKRKEGRKNGKKRKRKIELKKYQNKQVNQTNLWGCINLLLVVNKYCRFLCRNPLAMLRNIWPLSSIK